MYDASRRFAVVAALVLFGMFPSYAKSSHHRERDAMKFTFSEPGWVLSGAIIDDTRGYTSPPVALRLTNFGTGPVGYTATHALSRIPVGTTHVVRLWIKREVIGLLPQSALRIEVWSSDGGRVLLGTQFPLALTADFSFIDVGSFTNPSYDPDGFYILIQPTTPTFPESTRWVIDDIEIEEVDMKKWPAVSAAITALKSITGATYNNDLGSRVYTRLFTPQEQRDVKLPYACLPVDQEAERIEYEGFQFQSTWRLTGHAFFDDNSESDPLNSAGATSAAKFRDDIIRAFMADPDLGQTVNNCEVTNIETSAGIVDDGVSEVIFTVEFMQYGGAADLAVP